MSGEGKTSRPHWRHKPTLAAGDGQPCPIVPVMPGDYIASALAAERRIAQGVRQAQCDRCHLWRWPEEQRRCRGWRST